MNSLKKLILKSYTSLFYIFLFYFFIFFFSYPLFFKYVYSTSILNGYSSNTIYLLILIFLLFILSFLIFKLFNIKKFNYQFAEWNEIRCIFATFVIIFVIISSKFLRLYVSEIDCKFNFFFSPHILYFIFTSFVFTCSIQKNFKKQKIFIFLVYFICLIFIFNALLNTKSRTELIFFFGILFLEVIYNTKKNYLLLLIPLLILTLFNVQDRIKSTFPENLIGCNTVSTLEVLTTTNFYQDKYNKNIYRLGDSPKSRTKQIFQPFITRLASHHIFHQTIINHNNFEGNTIKYIYLNIIPDIFYKNEIDYNGNYLGRTFNLISSDDYQTGVGPTFIGELYLNYGIWSLFFIPIISFIYYFFSMSSVLTNNRGLFFYIIISFISIHSFEGFLYSYFQKLIISLIFMYFILIFVKKKSN